MLRHARRFALALGSCAAACGGAEAPAVPGPPQARSVLVVVVDDWARSDLEAARRDENPWNDLPAIDALAAAGQSWRHFYSQPACKPARHSLMFGEYWTAPTDVGICSSDAPSRPIRARPSLASLFQGAGYATAAFGKWHLAHARDPNGDWHRAPAAIGFDAWRAWNASNVDGHCGSVGYFEWHRVDDGVGTTSHDYHTDAVARAAEEWWRETPGPRLAYVSFQAPHLPLHMPPRELLPVGHPWPESPREQYEAMLVAMDRALARVLDAVDLENTFVVVVGDNGTAPRSMREEQHPLRGKSTTFQDGVNVPFVAAGPGVVQGTTDALGHVVDVMATLCDLAGLEVPAAPEIDSRSLAAVLRGEAREAREHLVCEFRSPDRSGTRAPESLTFPRHDIAVVVRDARTRETFKARWVENLDTGVTRRRVFDLTADPLERAPIEGEHPVLARARPVYRAYLERIEPL